MNAVVAEARHTRMSTERKRILLVDDHPIVRQGLLGLLEQDPHLGVCGQASGLQDGLVKLKDLRPDAAIVDICLGKDSGLEFIAQARAADPKLAILALSMLDEKTYAERALRQGANGYVMKHEATDHLIEAVHRILSGNIFVSQSVTERLLHTIARPNQETRYSMDRLTDRELEIFRLVGMGMGSANIAAQLGISPKTVEAHRGHIKEKLGLETGAELVIQAAAWIRDGRL
jgi:DNA-binding NarL/FixJ family response regulator